MEPRHEELLNVIINLADQLADVQSEIRAKCNVINSYRYQLENFQRELAQVELKKAQIDMEMMAAKQLLFPPPPPPPEPEPVVEPEPEFVEPSTVLAAAGEEPIVFENAPDNPAIEIELQAMEEGQAAAGPSIQ